MFEMSKIIQDLESELETSYYPGAIQWADANFDNAWSDAIETFDQALAKAIATQDFSKINFEADRYRVTILGLTRKYRAHLAKQKTMDLFKSKTEHLVK